MALLQEGEKMMGLNELAEKVHKTAKEKGFYKPLSNWMDLRNQVEEKVRVMCSPEYQEFFMTLIEQHERDFLNAFRLAQIALIHAELSEAVQADRDGNIELFNEEFGADVIIQILSVSKAFGIDNDYEVEKKMDKNEDRPLLHGRKY